MCRKRWNPLFGSEVDALRRNLDIFFLGLWFDGCTIEDGLERVDFVLDVVAELERGDEALLDEDCFARARVTCGAGLARFAGEGAEAADFDGVPVYQLFADKFEELFHNGLDVAPYKSGGLGYFLYQTLFRYVWHDIKYRLAFKKIGEDNKN